ncbi:MAG: M48 family metalloprotease [Chloroflexota bacterium]
MTSEPRQKTYGQVRLEHIQNERYRALGLSPAARDGAMDTSFEVVLNRITAVFSADSSGMPEAEIRAATAKIMRGLASTPTPTIYENPLEYGLLVNFAREIETAISETGPSLMQPPLLATLPLGRTNAMVMPFLSGEYGVLFETELFAFVNLVSKAVALCLPATRQDGFSVFDYTANGIRRALAGETGEQAMRRFGELLVAYIYAGRPTAAPPYVIDADRLKLAAVLRASAELFCVGHEYAHINNGHVAAATRVLSLLGHEEVEELQFAHEQEFEADDQAMTLMLAAMEKRGIHGTLAYAGADLFFTCTDVLDRALAVARTGQEAPSVAASHPASKDRRERLRTVLRTSLPECASAIHVARALEVAVEALFDSSLVRLRSYQRKGHTVATTWR